VGVVSRCDIWAAGFYQKPGAKSRTLIEHWDGAHWGRVPSPNPGGKHDNFLYGLAAVSRSNVWAVGMYGNGHGLQTLILHWDGSTHVPTPNPGGRSGDDWLTSISARSSTDIWAVGHYHVAATVGSIVLHYDGHAWSQVTGPLSIGGDPDLTAVAALSATNVWVVGSDARDDHTFAAEWDGKRWTKFHTPRPGMFSQLSNVTAISPHNVWAVGSVTPKIGGPAGAGQRTLALHWNGTAWSRVSTPTPSKIHGGGDLVSITATSTGSIWALGRYDTKDNQRSYLLHRHMGAWRRIDIANRRGTDGTILNDIAATSTNIWAVGDATTGRKYTTAAVYHG
jgi:hypothetical protein